MQLNCVMATVAFLSFHTCVVPLSVHLGYLLVFLETFKFGEKAADSDSVLAA